MEIYLECCPHCGKPVEYVEKSYEAYIICSDHNCLGGMSIKWGTQDDSSKYLMKLWADWNKRAKEQTALCQCIKAVEQQRIALEKELAEDPYSNNCMYCLDVLDKALDTMRVFTR